MFLRILTREFVPPELWFDIDISIIWPIAISWLSITRLIDHKSSLRSLVNCWCWLQTVDVSRYRKAKKTVVILSSREISCPASRSHHTSRSDSHVNYAIRESSFFPNLQNIRILEFSTKTSPSQGRIVSGSLSLAHLLRSSIYICPPGSLRVRSLPFSFPYVSLLRSKLSLSFSVFATFKGAKSVWRCEETRSFGYATFKGGTVKRHGNTWEFEIVLSWTARIRSHKRRLLLCEVLWRARWHGSASRHDTVQTGKILTIYGLWAPRARGTLEKITFPGVIRVAASL